jgi:hypothetical protein
MVGARCRFDGRQAARALLAAALAVALALALPGCAQRSPRASAASSPRPQIQANSTDVANAFARLNALQRGAKALPNTLAVYAFYLEHLQQSSSVTREFLAQVLAATEAEMGAYQEAVLQFPQAAPRLRNPAPPLPDPANFHAVNAADAIVDLAVRGYPIAASGTYVREPLYGEIIRAALRSGFVVVPYDSTRTDADAVAREEDQARHLLDRVFRAAPDARLFIHAGYAHVPKRADYFYTATLAMRLRRVTGFDPLSIDQTVLRPVEPGREYADYRELLRRFRVTQPSVLLRRADRQPWSLEPQVYDVSVLLSPPAPTHEGRPDWLRLGGERAPVSVDVDLHSARLPCLIEARYAAESNASVPADRMLLEHDGDKVVLFLHHDHYRIDAFCASGGIVVNRPLHVGG